MEQGIVLLQRGRERGAMPLGSVTVAPWWVRQTVPTAAFVLPFSLGPNVCVCVCALFLHPSKEERLS